jgi:hypothetical protein
MTAQNVEKSADRPPTSTFVAYSAINVEPARRDAENSTFCAPRSGSPSMLPL